MKTTKTPKPLVRARVDRRRKLNVEKIFKRYGLTASDAINVFFAKVEEVDGLPFDLRRDETTELLANPEFRAHLADMKAGRAQYVDGKDIT